MGFGGLVAPQTPKSRVDGGGGTASALSRLEPLEGFTHPIPKD